MVIEDCEIGPTAGSGIVLNRIVNAVVRGCILHDGGSALLGESADNIHLENCHDYVVENCISYDCLDGSTYDSSDSPASPTSSGQDWNSGVFRYNIAHGQTSSAHFKISGYHSSSYVGIHHNIAYDWDSNYAFTIQEETQGYMVGNVVYNHRAGFMVDTQRTTIVIANNIAYAVELPIIFGQDGVPAAESDYNIFYNCPDLVADYANGNTTTYSSLASWQSAYSDKYDQHSTTGDPKFVNAATYDFRLQSTSPAINAGKTFSDEELQFALDPTHCTWPLGVQVLGQSDHGTGWEIGAFVYVP